MVKAYVRSVDENSEPTHLVILFSLKAHLPVLRVKQSTMMRVIVAIADTSSVWTISLNHRKP